MTRQTKASAVVLISGSGSNLQAFIDQIEAGELNIEITKVISNNPDAFGLERAKKANIQTAVINHRDYDSRELFDQALMDCIDQSEPEIIILAGFMRILTTEFVEHYEHRLINIHPSLLPKYPGTNTHQRVLDADEAWHGASIHFVIPEVDAGPVILQGRLEIKQDDTASTLQQRIHKIEHRIYPLAVAWLADHRLSVVEGQVLLDDEKSSEQLQTFDV